VPWIFKQPPGSVEEIQQNKPDIINDYDRDIADFIMERISKETIPKCAVPESTCTCLYMIEYTRAIDHVEKHT
jgi:hypothetical protein